MNSLTGIMRCYIVCLISIVLITSADAVKQGGQSLPDAHNGSTLRSGNDSSCRSDEYFYDVTQRCMSCSAQCVKRNTQNALYCIRNCKAYLLVIDKEPQSVDCNNSGLFLFVPTKQCLPCSLICMGEEVFIPYCKQRCPNPDHDSRCSSVQFYHDGMQKCIPCSSECNKKKQQNTLFCIRHCQVYLMIVDKEPQSVVCNNSGHFLFVLTNQCLPCSLICTEEAVLIPYCKQRCSSPSIPNLQSTPHPDLSSYSDGYKTTSKNVLDHTTNQHLLDSDYFSGNGSHTVYVADKLESSSLDTFLNRLFIGLFILCISIILVLGITVCFFLIRRKPKQEQQDNQVEVIALLATRNLQNQQEVVTPVVENQSDIENNSNVSGHLDNGEPLSVHHPVIHTEFELPREDVSGGVTVHHDGDNDVGDQNTIDENRILNGTQICSTSQNPEKTSKSNQVQRLRREENGADPRVSQFVSNLDPSTELSLPSTIISLKSDPLDFELDEKREK